MMAMMATGRPPVSLIFQNRNSTFWSSSSSFVGGEGGETDLLEVLLEQEIFGRTFPRGESSRSVMTRMMNDQL